MAGRPYLRAPDGTGPSLKESKERTLPVDNLISELGVKSNGQRDSFRPTDRAVRCKTLVICKLWRRSSKTLRSQCCQVPESFITHAGIKVIASPLKSISYEIHIL